MEYSEFVALSNSGKLKVKIDYNMAERALVEMPRHYSYNCCFWLAAFILVPTILILLAIFRNPWFACGLVVGCPITFWIMKRSLYEAIIDYSLRQPWFFRKAVFDGLIKPKRR